MPARSVAQRNYIYAKFGASWAKKHHYDTGGTLPLKLTGEVRKPVKKGLDHGRLKPEREVPGRSTRFRTPVHPGWGNAGWADMFREPPQPGYGRGSFGLRNWTPAPLEKRRA